MTRLRFVVFLFCTVAVLFADGHGGTAAAATPEGHAASLTPNLSAIMAGIAPLSDDARLRRNIAQATFCLPQNVLGVFFYAALQLAGHVEEVEEANEVKVIVTSLPFGASLGRFLFVGRAILTDRAVRHEYGHTLQGYRSGPFYLLLEGLVSFVQAGISLLSPSFAASYFERWPENDAETLGATL